PWSTPMRLIGTSDEVQREYHFGSGGSSTGYSAPSRSSISVASRSTNGDCRANGSTTGTFTQIGFGPPLRISSSPEPRPARVRPIGRPSPASDSMRRPRQNSSISSSTGFSTGPVNDRAAREHVAAVTHPCERVYRPSAQRERSYG